MGRVSCGVIIVLIIPERESSFSWSEFMFRVGSSTSGSDIARMSGRLKEKKLQISTRSVSDITDITS